jgi:hypothetical protein
MTETPKDTYEALLTTLLEENYKEYNKRNHEYYSDTLNLFNKAGETDSVHHLWRHKYMIQEMISILTSHERTQNWWKYEEFDSYPDPELDLEQYINSEVYPSIARKDLELMAAQEYIKETKGILIPLPNHTQEAIVTPEDNKTSNYQLENKLKTEGEEINFSQIAKKADHLNIPRDALRKKCERIAKDARAGTKMLPCPVYPDDEEFKYAVIKISDNPKEKTKGMLFQKIVDSKED